MRNLINYDLTCGTQPTRSAAHFVGARAVPVYRAPSATSTTACTPLKIHRGAAGGGGEGGGATLLVLSKEGEALYSLGLRLPTLAAAMEFANAHDGMSAGGRPAVRVARCRDGRRGDGVFATRPIAAHETIFVESPMASVPRFWDTPTANATPAAAAVDAGTAAAAVDAGAAGGSRDAGNAGRSRSPQLPAGHQPAGRQSQPGRAGAGRAALPSAETYCCACFAAFTANPWPDRLPVREKWPSPTRGRRCPAGCGAVFCTPHCERAAASRGHTRLCRPGGSDPAATTAPAAALSAYCATQLPISWAAARHLPLLAVQVLARLLDERGSALAPTPDAEDAAAPPLTAAAAAADGPHLELDRLQRASAPAAVGWGWDCTRDGMATDAPDQADGHPTADAADAADAVFAHGAGRPVESFCRGMVGGWAELEAAIEDDWDPSRLYELVAATLGMTTAEREGFPAEHFRQLLGRLFCNTIDVTPLSPFTQYLSLSRKERVADGSTVLAELRALAAAETATVGNGGGDKPTVDTTDAPVDVDGFFNARSSVPGSAVFALHSKLNHDCDGNAMAVSGGFTSAAIEIVAVRSIAPGDEICTSYVTHNWRARARLCNGRVPGGRGGRGHGWPLVPFCRSMLHAVPACVPTPRMCTSVRTPDGCPHLCVCSSLYMVFLSSRYVNPVLANADRRALLLANHHFECCCPSCLRAM